MRSSPDSNPYNNYSFPGNTNPYTGKVAPGNPDTYLRNYYNRNDSEGSGSGAILEILSGQIYKVDDADQVDSELWLATEDVLICTDTMTFQGKKITIHKIINKDSNGEEVDATRLH